MRNFILFIVVGLSLMLSNCKGDKQDHQEHESGSYYTCPMHPSVKSDSPGSCPVCGMSLIKVEQKENSHSQHKGNFITISEQQQRLAGIETDTVRFNSILPISTIFGTVAIDQEGVSTISSRVKGRVEILHVKTTGEYLRKGVAIYAIYSEELYSDEKEYISLLEKRKQNSSNIFLDDLIESSKNKLQLWGLTKQQITELEKTKKANPLLTYYSQKEGYVTEVFIKEGMYVEEGTQLMEIANLNHVWIEAQIYTNDKELSTRNYTVYSEAFPNEIYQGTLVYSNPKVEKNRKIQLMRLKVTNSNKRLIPGMIVYVNPKSAENKVLTVPKSALLLEKMKTVWVKVDATTFEQRMVKTGVENNLLIEILSGINKGEIIVSEGAYLISSEFILKKGTTQRHQH